LRTESASVGRRALFRSRWFASLAFGVLASAFSTSQLAHSEITDIGEKDGSFRWLSYLGNQSADSVDQVEVIFTQPEEARPVETAESETTDPDSVTVNPAGTNKFGEPDISPDEERINRADKKKRVISVVPVAPPRQFSAGSVLKRTSLLEVPEKTRNPQMAFAKPDIMGKEVQIATAFHHPVRESTKDNMPVMLASLVNNDHYDVLATAYAPAEPDYVKHSPFASILTDKEEQGRFYPPIMNNDHSWAGTALPAQVFSEGEQRCLAAGVYFESRGEPVKGQAAVAQVILNRVRNPAYPNTVCGVVYQNKRWRNRCQFSFACDGIRDRVRSPQHWEMAKDVAMAVTAGKIWLDEVGSATHYHAVYVHPRWARHMKKVGRIGLHVFYRTYGGGWS